MESNTVKKPKIEAIYPLTAMQQGLLFHHLTPGEDQGFLMVQCKIKGNLDKLLLEKAWNMATQRHETMRTSVHWKKVEKPLLLVQPKKDIICTFLDWSSKNTTEQDILLEQYKKERKEIGVNFEKNPLSKISIIKKTEYCYYFLWECHHLLLDGWSSTIILKDAFAYYNNLSTGKTVELAAIPSYKSYRNWLQNIPLEDAKNFWKKTFKNHTKSTLFQENSLANQGTPPSKFSNQFSIETSNDLKNLAKYYKITLNTLFQGIWSLLLAKCFETKDVTFGTTVSGRSVPFPNIELMSGMFANVLPCRTVLQASKSFQENLKVLQSQQQASRNYEYCKLDEIISWAALPQDKPLFDNLFVFENFPWETIKSGNIAVSDFESGITTTYPLTIIFKIEGAVYFDVLANTNVLPIAVIEWIKTTLPQIAKLLLDRKDVYIDDLLTELPNISEVLSRKHLQDNLEQQEAFEKKETTYKAPKNQTELVLVEIWEKLFNLNYISITDSFFHLGGKSLLSVKMFAFIKEKLNVKLPPTTLLEYPTIQELANIIDSKSDKKSVEWKYLVPIKTKGNKSSLFCIHAGGGHVFFYKSLADAIDVERPVYALQPVGIFGEDNKHKNIVEMARDYADEIRILQPEGTLNIVVYCFSTAVGLEMAAYLKTVGRKTHLIVADTIAEHRLLLDKERFYIRTSAFLKRFLSNPFKALNEMIGYRILFYIKPIRVQLFGNDAEKNTEQMRQHLVNLFNAYNWNKKNDLISLILTEKGDERYNQEIIRSWKPIVDGKIKVAITKGKHSTFFEAPDVTYTAKAIDKVIIED